jgi:hypothetical protein
MTTVNFNFCPLCAQSQAHQTFSALFTHVRTQHAGEQNFCIRCELSETCGSCYSTFESYRSHIINTTALSLMKCFPTSNHAVLCILTMAMIIQRFRSTPILIQVNSCSIAKMNRLHHSHLHHRSLVLFFYRWVSHLICRLSNDTMFVFFWNFVKDICFLRMWFSLLLLIFVHFLKLSVN